MGLQVLGACHGFLADRAMECAGLQMSGHMVGHRSDGDQLLAATDDVRFAGMNQSVVFAESGEVGVNDC